MACAADKSVAAAKAAKPGDGKRGLQGLPTGWFAEVSDMWPGVAAGIQVKQVLYHERSTYQVRPTTPPAIACGYVEWDRIHDPRGDTMRNPSRRRRTKDEQTRASQRPRRSTLRERKQGAHQPRKVLHE
eukprot:scaffold341_cov368-Pavlova_lutheri.AAC.4